MSSKETLLGLSRTPEPMAPLTHVIITPENIAAEARISRATPLGWFQLRRLKQDAAKLERAARQMNLDKKATLLKLREMRETLQEMQTQRDELNKGLQATPEDTVLQTQHAQLMARAIPLWEEYEGLKGEYQQLVNLEKQAAAIRQRIADNPIVIQKRKEQTRKLQIQREEAMAYEQLITEAWTRLKYCYTRKDKQGREKTDRVKFVQCDITEDAVYFKIAISRRSWVGGYVDLLPYGVAVYDLIKEDTLYELSTACQRQVTAKRTPKGGAWVIVHRLDTNDGLVEQVRYATAMEGYPNKIRSLLPICVGVTYGLEFVWLNIAQYPHMLVAGFTGAGKSNFINVIISTLITQHSPEDVRLILVDLKDGLEFSPYEKLPHLHNRVIDNTPALADQLQELEAVMSERNHLMRGKAKTLAQYNAKYPEGKLPRIICIIDEVASILGHGDTTKRIHSSLQQLTAKGRAPGIHIILSTQRPDVSAIPGNIKVNLAARIVGRMPSQIDSQTVLGTGDAKDLADVPGRMLLQIGPTPQPVQTPYIDEGDIAAALSRAMEWETPAALPVPQKFTSTNEWTPERIVELSLNFLGGNIGHHAIWNEIKDEGNITNAQLREMVKRVWAMDCIAFGDKEYRVERGKGHIRRLVEIVKTDEGMKTE